ncbi:hypothetical protein IE53DRAFT_8955 [Violaceomyces palustris]|uniref:Uncharacterized protein n=1 Tax=Violaceomyces palustris TaxID=1673888 RepID=A0ACD0P2P6_9BASI|nr:hypothetical protein IE53DRAFT_8955 [Violaceomyces palustris]
MDPSLCFQNLKHTSHSPHSIIRIRDFRVSDLIYACSSFTAACFKPTARRLNLQQDGNLSSLQRVMLAPRKGGKGGGGGGERRRRSKEFDICRDRLVATLTRCYQRDGSGKLPGFLKRLIDRLRGGNLESLMAVCPPRFCFLLTLEYGRGGEESLTEPKRGRAV